MARSARATRGLRGRGRGTFGLSGSTWAVEEVDGRPVRVFDRAHPPHLNFPNTGGVELWGCNLYLTSLTATGGSLTFPPGIRALGWCPAARDAQDEVLENALLATKTYRHENGFLLLIDDRGQPRLRARRAVQP